MSEIILKINFHKSTSANYKNVIKLSKFFKNFVQEENNNSIEIDQEELILHKRKILNLINYIQSWKNSEILYKEIKITRSGINLLSSMLDCSQSYENSYNKDKHCFIDNYREGWHCKHIKDIKRHLPEHYYDYFHRRGQFWFDFGSFDTDENWIFNKEHLLSCVMKEAEKNYLQFCPYFKQHYIENIISDLPSKICLKDNNDWVINEKDVDNGLKVEKKKIGIIPKKIMDEALGIDNMKGIGFGASVSTKNDEPKEKENDSIRNIPEVSFNEIGGLDDILMMIREIIELPIKTPDLFKHLGIKPHKGILLFGPSGCGKTLIAKAIANEIQAHFIDIKGPELFNKYIGQSFENLRNIFAKAYELQPAIIFFDEIDAIAHSRSESEINLHDSQFVNQLLTLMDGMEDYGNVRVIASTNRPELLDNALLRPGRFDYHIEIKKPTLDGCKEIFKINIQDMPIESTFNPDSFAEKLFGLTGADIAFIVRESAYNCIRRKVIFSDIIDNKYPVNFNDFIITKDDFNNALNKLSDR